MFVKKILFQLYYTIYRPLHPYGLHARIPFSEYKIEEESLCRAELTWRNHILLLRKLGGEMLNWQKINK